MNFFFCFVGSLFEPLAALLAAGFLPESLGFHRKCSHPDKATTMAPRLASSLFCTLFVLSFYTL